MSASIKESKELLHKLIASADVMIIFLDREENIVICNRKVEELSGLKQEELVGSNWLKAFFRSKDNDIKRDMLKAVADDSSRYMRPREYEGIIFDKAGKEKFISWSFTPIIEEAKIEGSLIIGHDVSELKRRESSLKKIDDTLKNIFSSIREYALYVVNLDGYINYFGMGSEAMLGWSRKDIIFKHVSLLHTAEDAQKLHFILEHVRLFGKYEIELDLVNKDGELIPVSLSANQYIDSEGRLSGYVFVAKDISERKKMEYQIFQAEKLAALGQLSAGMAHEINNPLFVISGRLQIMLEEEKGLNKKVRDTLVLINAQAERIRKLVDRILRFSRKSVPVLENIDVNEALESVLPLIFYHKFSASKICIEKHLAKDMPAVKGDIHQLQEVFINLLVNACQSMPHGGLIVIKTENFEKLYVKVSIKDTGVGIHPNNMKNIFMPFFSTKSDGTGLGLSICYNIIKNHNGSIEINSQLNQGTTFVIKLPFA